MHLLHNEITYKRTQHALRSLKESVSGGASGGGGSAAGGRLSAASAQLCHALLGHSAVSVPPAVPPAEGSTPAEGSMTPLSRTPLSNRRLNEGQRLAVSRALNASPLALIHGPPGTGKTTAVVELILQVPPTPHPTPPQARAQRTALCRLHCIWRCGRNGGVCDMWEKWVVWVEK